jgi:hypothetical protein
MRFAALIGSLCVACSSAGPYGYSPTYTPLAEEEDATQGAKEYDPIMAKRFPEEWRDKPVSVFGVVTNRGQAAGGASRLTLSVRTLASRNLCDAGGEDTCRVTVSDREHAIVHANVKLRSGDDIGEKSAGPGSLVRVVGKFTDVVDNDDGNAIINGSYYRHWPVHHYVTTAASSYMRR